jgi:hypothetical protein
MPASALLAVVAPILTPIWLAGGLTLATGTVAFGIVVSAALGGVLAGIVTRRRLLSRGGAAATGMAVTVFAYFLYGEVAYATALLLSRMGYIDPGDPDLRIGWVKSSLVLGFLAMWLTWWFTLPIGAGAGLLAWRSAAGRRGSAIPAPGSAGFPGDDGS